MSTLLPPNFVLEDVSEEDLIIASLAWGFTLGFGWLTIWTAIKQTRSIWRRYSTQSVHNTYIWLIWLEILVCLIFGVICWMYLLGRIHPSFAFYFIILTTWALQVQFLLQIIINRCALLISDRHKVRRLKFWVAFLITAINISVYNIWIPARLQISDRYIWINEWWDRCEKVIYLLVDGALNIYFVWIVKRTLISNGLTKYKRLTNFNIFIICFSLSMDVLIISMMSLRNTFVYMQFHPLAYMVKLKIEMSMADLIAKVAKKKESTVAASSPTPRSRLVSLSSPIRTLTRSNASRIQPLPPARNAVPFKLWSVTTQSTGVDGIDSTLSSTLHENQETAYGNRVMEAPLRDRSSRDLYMLQEVTVELGPIPSGVRHPGTMYPTPEVYNESTDEESIPVIWDGSGYFNSTVTATGRRPGEC